MVLKMYNTLSRQKEVFVPWQPGQVSMYVCGVTVYESSHIGHAMSAITFDMIRRYLEYRNYQVSHVMNFTDIDDKIIQRAHAEQIAWRSHRALHTPVSGMDGRPQCQACHGIPSCN